MPSAAGAVLQHGRGHGEEARCARATPAGSWCSSTTSRRRKSPPTTRSCSRTMQQARPGVERGIRRAVRRRRAARGRRRAQPGGDRRGARAARPARTTSKRLALPGAASRERRGGAAPRLAAGEPALVWRKLDRRHRNAGRRGAQADRARARRFPARIGRRRRGARALQPARARSRPGVPRHRRTPARSTATGRHDRDAFEPLPGDSLAELRALVDACRIEVPEALPPALACLVGYFGYETIGLVEKLPRAPRRARSTLPDMLFVRPTLILVFDRLADELLLRRAAVGRRAAMPAARSTRAGERIDEALRRLSRRRCRAPVSDATLPDLALDAGACRRPTTRRWCSRRRTTSPPATSSRSCSRSASPARSRCRRSRSTARCGG